MSATWKNVKPAHVRHPGSDYGRRWRRDPAPAPRPGQQDAARKGR